MLLCVGLLTSTPMVCFKASNDSNFYVGENILSTAHHFYEARICLELVKQCSLQSEQFEKNAKFLGKFF